MDASASIAGTFIFPKCDHNHIVILRAVRDAVQPRKSIEREFIVQDIELI